MGRCPLIIPLILLISIILICDFANLNAPVQPTYWGEQICEGDIQEIKDTKTSGRLAIMKVKRVNGVKIVPYKLRVYLLDELPLLIAGQTITIKGNVQPLDTPISIPDAIDLNKSLRLNGVTSTVIVEKEHIINVENTRGLLPQLKRWNSHINDRLCSLPISNISIEMLSAMLLGNDQYLTEENRDIFSAAGLSHILALSGMHVGIILVIINILLWPLYYSRHTQTRHIASILILWCYAAFTGFIPSVTRAVIMASIFIFGRILQRKTVPLNSLCLAAIIVLIINPHDLYSIGFQLSFMAVAGIIIFYPILNNVNQRKYPMIYWLLSFPILSLTANILTALISSYHFHVFPIYFIIANILIVLIMPLFISSGIISLIFSWNGLTDILSATIQSIASMVSTFPSATISALYPTAWYVITLTIIVSLVGIAIYYKKRFLIYELVLLFFGVIAINMLLPQKTYPISEHYSIKHGKEQIIVERINNKCSIYSGQKSHAERQAIKEHFELVLFDYMNLREIDSINVIYRGASYYKPSLPD